MGKSFQTIDRLAMNLARGVIRFRWLVIVAALASAVAIGTGAGKLEFANNYRVFFSDENPELNAFEDLQATYTKNDNFLFVLEPADGDAFSSDTLAAVEQLTEGAWQIPFAIRVDSISNFQHTYGIDDDLIVEDLFEDAAAVGGFEYSFYGIADSDADLGVLLEYLYDDRDSSADTSVPPTAFDNDLFVGTRLALNDASDTSVLAGATIDLDSGELFINVEAERRFGDRLSTELRVRAFLDAQPGDVLYFLEQDDYVQLRLSWYY